MLLLLTDFTPCFLVSCKSRVTRLKLKNMSWKSKMRAQSKGYEFKSRSYELLVGSSNQRVQESLNQKKLK